MKLTPGQHAALDVLNLRLDEGAPVVSLSGAAGCGKTTSMKAFVDDKPEAVVVTPTNKAATMLQSKGVQASTLYAKFFIRDEYRDANGRKQLRFIPCYQAPAIPEGKMAFADKIVIDEASMLGSWALDHLRRMCNQIVLVGDSNQLPPVNDRNNPRGFFCSRDHDAHLSEVLRNRGRILDLATEVRLSKDGIRLASMDVDDFYPEENFETLYTIERPQLICWRNSVRRLLNIRARKVLGLGDTILPVPGDLMVCRSNYSEELLNGTQATLLQFTWSGASRFANVLLQVSGGSPIAAEMDMVWFLKDQPAHDAEKHQENLRGIPSSDDEEGLQLTYGYAITAHTAQGGEWPAVCVIDERFGVRGMARAEYEKDPRSLPPDDVVRRWFYTSVTRAQTSLFIANDQWTRQ